jgi:hypothetical protein
MIYVLDNMVYVVDIDEQGNKSYIYLSIEQLMNLC